MQDVVVVSLFNGLSGGRLALADVAELNVLRYYSSEIDKYAIQVADANFPEDIPYKLGDVRGIDTAALLADVSQEFPGAPIMLIGGSPCQSFSFAGKQNGATTTTNVEITSLAQYLELASGGFEFDGYSYLFWEFMRVKEGLSPTYYLLENVKMSKHWEDVLTSAVGDSPILINSSLVSAQNRARLYWTNIQGIVQPTDLGLIPADVLPDNYEPFTIEQFKPGVRGNIVREYNAIIRSTSMLHTCACTSGWQDNKVGIMKSPTLRAMNTFTLIRTANMSIRRVTPTDAEILQTVPLGYTAHVSNTQRLKMLGNGWTIRVISHILRYIVNNARWQ